MGQTIAADRALADVGKPDSVSTSRETLALSLVQECWEKDYLRWLSKEIEKISSRWHKLDDKRKQPLIEPTPAHTKQPQGQQGLKALLSSRLFRYFQSDYGQNPALRDVELSVRAGFGKRVKIRDLVKELRKFKTIVVLGDPGSGKSVCLRKLAHDLAQQGLKQTRPVTLPVLLFMDNYDGWKDKVTKQPMRIQDFVEQCVQNHESVRYDPHNHPLLPLARNLDSLLREGRVTCIFDALDEMPQDRSDLRYQELKGFMNYWGGIHERNRFIFSCRCLDYDPAFEVDEVIIDPFDLRQILSFLKNNLPLEIADSLYERIVEDDSLQEIVSNPFFLQALVYINDPSRGNQWHIPKTRGELIRAFVETLLQYEAEEKQPEALKNVGGRDVLFRFLADLGFVLQQRREGGTSAPTKDLDELWRRHPKWKELLRIARRARILGRRGEEADDQVDSPPPQLEPPNRIEFVHHRIQEFFAAVELARRLEEAEPIERYLEDIWWQETVILAIGIVQQPGLLLSKMLGRRPETTHGLTK